MSRVAPEIAPEIIASIKSRVDIVGIVQEHVPLKKAGKEYKACCPFHSEKTPSFTVSPSKQFYHCFGCGERGDSIDWMVKYLGVPWREAVARLAEMAGIPLPENDDSALVKAKSDVSRTLEKAARWMHRYLMDTPRARAYVFGTRNVAENTAEQFLLGYAPRVMQDYSVFSLKEKEILVEAGVLGLASGRMYPKMGGRVMFPIRDAAGWVIGFSGRVLEVGHPKYMNSPDSRFFHKRRELFRAPDVRRAARAANRVVVTEGHFDAVSLFEAGFGYVVAGMGTATTPENLESMFALAPEVVFCFDGDEAGQAAAWKALLASLPVIGNNRLASFAFVPDGMDPDEYVRTHGQAEFARLLDESVPLSRFFIETFRARKEATPLEKHSAILTEAASRLKSMNDAILRQGLAVALSEVFGVSAAVVRSAVGFSLVQAPVKAAAPSVRADALETSFLANLLRRPWEADCIAADVELKVQGGTQIVALLRMAGLRNGCSADETRGVFLDEPCLPLVDRLLASGELDEPLAVLGKRIEADWLNRSLQSAMASPSIDRALVGGIIARRAMVLQSVEVAA
ncbi:MAG: DNA primase [Hydrogenophilales bacterium 17-61-9]|nr:MAG: DNA primase [Hydrogenophilales bacterium 17-61-9]